MDSVEKIKILAVDDNQHNLIAMEAVFYGSFYELVPAESGFDAIKILQQDEDIALVLLDVQMPEMDGFETASKIKKIPGHEETPIIFITAYYREDPYVMKGYASGAVDYFGKPFDPELLKTKVNLYASFRQKSILLKERERRIKETEELLKAGRRLTDVFEHLTVGVLIADHDGEIFQCNEFASKILNASEAQSEDHYGEILNWWAESGKNLFRAKDGFLAKAINDGKSTHNKSITIHCIDSTEKSILVSASPLVGKGAVIMGAVVILQDMTQTRRIEEEFEDKVSRLVSLSVDLGHVSKEH